VVVVVVVAVPLLSLLLPLLDDPSLGVERELGSSNGGALAPVAGSVVSVVAMAGRGSAVAVAVAVAVVIAVAAAVEAPVATIRSRKERRVSPDGDDGVVGDGVEKAEQKIDDDNDGDDNDDFAMARVAAMAMAMTTRFFMIGSTNIGASQRAWGGGLRGTKRGWEGRKR